VAATALRGGLCALQKFVAVQKRAFASRLGIADLSPPCPPDEPRNRIRFAFRFFETFDLDQGEDCVVTYLNLTKFPGPSVALATGGIALILEASSPSDRVTSKRAINLSPPS
jgi:hypothetical protein